MAAPSPLIRQSQASIAESELYRAGEPLQDFGAVNPGTALECLNLNWTERDLPERVRTKHVHRLHPYLGKYIPQMVEIFLRKYVPGRVYDPFVGSGTTLVEANALAIEAYGTDVSVFNCLLSAVKTGRYDISHLRAEVLDALARVQENVSQGLLFDSSTEQYGGGEIPSDYLKSWFAPAALATLLQYRSAISSYDYADVLKIILSRAARSSRLTRHFDLDCPKFPQRQPYYCYKHRRTCQPTTDALGFLRRYSLDTIRRIEEFSAIRSSAAVHIMHEDARTVSLPKIDMLMTSPPYVGLIDYHEQHRYAYELLGLVRADEDEIGPASKGKSMSARSAYRLAMGDVFRNARRYMDAGAVAVIVIGDREGLYEGLAEECGFSVERRFQRHVNRRTGRRSADFYEDVLVWRAV